MSLGRVGVVTLDQARKEAIRVQGRVSLGNDPANNRQDDLAEACVRDLSERYMNDHCEGRCKESTINAHNWLLNKFILPRFAARRLSELTTQDIGRFHQSLRPTPYNANRCLGLLKAMYSCAEQRGLMPPNSNPARPIHPFRERKRQRYLSPEEFVRLFDAIDSQERFGVIDRYQAAAIRLLALTGCRRGEILQLTWDNFDLRNRRLTFFKHKTDHQGIKSVPLNDEAFDILQSLPRKNDNPFVIAGRKPGARLINLRKPWLRVIEVAGLEDLRLHDLRHSFASAAASAGVPIQIVGALLGHASPQSTARYAHLYDDPLRNASRLTGSIIYGHQSR